MGISFVENHRADGPSMSFPVRWNIGLERAHLERLKVSLWARVLGLGQDWDWDAFRRTIALEEFRFAGLGYIRPIQYEGVVSNTSLSKRP